MFASPHSGHFSNDLLTLLLVSAPTTMGETNPGMVPHIFVIPIKMPEYLKTNHIKGSGSSQQLPNKSGDVKSNFLEYMNPTQHRDNYLEAMSMWFEL